MSDIVCEKFGGGMADHDRPCGQMNSLDYAAHEELVDVWRAFDRDDTARVGVITGAGRQGVLRRRRPQDLYDVIRNLAAARIPSANGSMASASAALRGAWR